MSKRILKALSAATFGVFVIAAGSVFAQGGTPGAFPPQTDLFNDAFTLAWAIPIIAAIGIVFGIYLGKTTIRRRSRRRIRSM